MRTTTNHWLRAVLALALTATSVGAAAPKTQDRRRCVTDSDHLNTFVFTDVTALAPGDAISVRGIYFTGARRPAPFHGSALMASDGSVRLGLFVNSATGGTNDFTLSGVTDTNFAGPVSFDNDGDFRFNGSLQLVAIACDTVSIP